MTMALGFKCVDGLVLCTDSLESDGFTKRNVTKTKLIGYSDWTVALAGAGGGGILDKFFRDAGDAIRQETGGVYDVKKIEVAIEGLLTAYRVRFSENAAFRIIAGFVNKPTIDRRLYCSDEDCLSPIQEHVQVGVGASLWRFLIENLYDKGMYADECAALGAFILRQAGNYVSDVGGPPQIIVYKIGDQWFKGLSPEDIAKLESRLKDAELGDLLRRYWRSRMPFKRAWENAK